MNKNIMFNKILVIWWSAFILILVFSSMASSSINAPFLWMDVSIWSLILYSSIIGLFVWYWFKWMVDSKDWDDENYDF